MSGALYADLAAIIEFAGAIIVSFHALLAAPKLLQDKGIWAARQTMAQGAIAGLDFKLAATLLKILTLAQFQQLGIFAATVILRLVLKKSFRLFAAS
jgi:hypothetical protein